MGRMKFLLGIVPMFCLAGTAHSVEFDFHQHDQSTQSKRSWSQTSSGIQLVVTGSDDLVLMEHGMGVEDDEGNELDAKKGNKDSLVFKFYDDENQPLNVVINRLRVKMFEPKVSQDKATIIQLDGKELASLNASMDYNTSSGFGQDRHVGQTWSLEEDVEVIGGFTLRPEINAGFLVYDIEVEAMDMPPVFRSQPVVITPEGQPYLYQLDVRDEFPTELNLALVEGPEGMLLDDQQAQLKWEPGFESQGIYPVMITATDKEGQETQHKFNLEVSNSNQPPLFTSTPILKAKETIDYQYKISTLDKDQDEVFLKILEAPIGMEYDEKTQILSWKPNYNHAGDHFIKLGASDVFDETQQSFTIRVEDTNRLPKITSKALEEVNEGKAYAYQITASDPDQDTLTYKLIHGPETLTIDSVTGRVQWQPDYLQAGLHKVKVQVDDGKRGIGEQNFEIEVENVNRLPEFTSVPVDQIEENQFYRYRLQAKDADLTGLTFALEDGPTGMKLNETVNSIQWQPDFDDAGLHEVVVSVTDGEDTVEQSFKVQVTNHNRLPVWQPIAHKVINEGELLELEVEATDMDDHTITYELLQAPAELALNPKTGDIHWTPAHNQAGQHQVWVRALDELGGKSESFFNIRVNNVNRAPQITSKAVSQAHETQTYFYDVQANDTDQDTLTYTLKTGPKGMRIDRKKGYLTWQPGFGDSGKYPVTVDVSDGFTQVSQSFELTVANENRLPTWVSAPVTKGAETQKYEYTLAVKDEDNDNIFFELLSGPTGMTLDEKTQTLHWTPSYEQSGLHNVVVRATDGHSGKIQQTYSIDVKNRNRAPKWISKAETSVKENRLYRYQLAATDADGDRLRYKLVAATKGFKLDPTNHTLTWKPGYRSAGRHDVKLSVTDGKQSVEQRFTLAVHDSNRVPKINSVAPSRIKEGQLYEYKIAASDLDTDELSYSLLQAPQGMNIEPSTGMVQWDVQYEDAGQHGIEIEVSDNKGGIVTQTVALTVENVNRKPEFTSEPETKLMLGKPFRYRLEAKDPDWNELTFRLLSAPEGMKLDKDTQTLYWSGKTVKEGSFDVVVELTDGEAKLQQSFALTVKSPTAIATSDL